MYCLEFVNEKMYNELSVRRAEIIRRVGEIKEKHKLFLETLPQIIKRKRNELARMNKEYAVFNHLVERDGGKCRLCEAETDYDNPQSYVELTIDHIVPLAKGGTNDLENLQLLCRSCNCKKGAR